MNNFDKSYLKLKDWVYKNELQRRKWSKEIWGYPSGKLFRIFKIATPILSFIGAIILGLYAAIIDMSNIVGYRDPIPFSEVLITLALLSVVVLVSANVLIFFKKLKLGGWINGIAAFLSAIHLVSQCKIEMPNNQFFILTIVGASLLAILTVASLYMPIVLMKEKREIEKMTQNTLKKITADAPSLLSPDEYAQMIEDYLEAEQEKDDAHRNKIKRKRAERR